MRTYCILLFISLFFWSCGTKDTSLTHFEAPDFTLTSLTDLEVSLEQLQGTW
ncbi:MAG: hypothetical protein AAF564_04180 [Bacteroidota bacterium]